MRIEHAAYQVQDPAAMGDWYCTHLGFQVKRSGESPVPVRFLADESGTVMIEVYNNPELTTPDYRGMSPLLLHLALCCEDVPGTVERLVTAGATVVSGPETTAAGDELAMLRDPWGFAIQLARRAEPMV